MDTNQDGYIAPEEFDENLTETIMKKFNSLYYEVYLRGSKVSIIY